jgi:hypothetical protein
MHDHHVAEKIIPREFTVKITLPTEADALLRDLHNDRQMIAAGMAVIVALLALVVLKYIWPRKA